MDKNKEDVLNTLKLAKELNSCENTEYGFTYTDIDEILECLTSCENSQLIDSLNSAKEILAECLKKNPDEGTHVTRIRLSGELIDQIIDELNLNLKKLEKGYKTII